MQKKIVGETSVTENLNFRIFQSNNNNKNTKNVLCKAYA